MSLINDALKRAKEAQSVRPAGPNQASFLQPVEYTRHSHTGAVYVSMSLLVVSLGVWCLFKGWDATHSTGLDLPVRAVNARETASLQMAEEPALSEEPASRMPIIEAGSASSTSNPPSRELTLENPPAQTPAPETPVLAAAPAAQPALPVTPPPSPMSHLRLQAIFYRSTSPSAVINGRTLFIGDRIDDVRVTSIARETVTLQAKGETKVLTLY